MLGTARHRAGDEGGFTLIELLVVILIIGILAAIAIPSFLNQKGKSTDASAKELARTAQTAAETIAADNQGSYATVSPQTLNGVEGTIPITVSTSNAYLDPSTGTSGVSATGYTVTATSVSGNKFSVTNNAGTVSRSCTVASGASSGGCPSGTW